MCWLAGILGIMMPPLANKLSDANGCQAERPRKRNCGSSETKVREPIDTPPGAAPLSLGSFDNPAVWQRVTFGWRIWGQAQTCDHQQTDRKEQRMQGAFYCESEWLTNG